MLRLIVRANGRREKVPVLLKIREVTEELKVLLRLGHDSHALPSFRSFEHAVGLVTDRARQNEGWLKSHHKGRPRAGLGLAAGFPLRRVGVYEQRALEAGVAVVHVVEIDPSHQERIARTS